MAAWRNETRAWCRAMLKTPRPNTEILTAQILPTGLTLEHITHKMEGSSVPLCKHVRPM